MYEVSAVEASCETNWFGNSILLLLQWWWMHWFLMDKTTPTGPERCALRGVNFTVEQQAG